MDKVVLTRLTVGHTHEDIDAVFALIWCYLRNEFILTPSEFVDLIKEAVASKVNVFVTDIFAVPDYCEFFKGFIDPTFARAHKEEWAQLQITFERAEVSEAHPLGVRMTYKAYAQDTFVEIVEDTRKS